MASVILQLFVSLQDYKSIIMSFIFKYILQYFPLLFRYIIHVSPVRIINAADLSADPPVICHIFICLAIAE